MPYSVTDLRGAANAGAISATDLERLLAFLSQREVPEPGRSAGAAARFDAAHLLWYAGALIVIGAMGLFSTVAFSQMGGGALTTCAIVYAIGFAVVGHTLWQVATVAAGVVALRYYRFPFIVALIAVALWFMSMDLAPWFAGVDHFDFAMRRLVSIWFGFLVLAVAWTVDYRSRDGDFAFWLHLFGLLAFWGGITSSDSATELGRAVYCLFNAGLLALAVILMRRAYAVFGAMGICFYFGHLANVVFKNSLLFPFALSLIGIVVIAAGLFYHRNEQAIAAWLAAHLPEAVLRLRPG